METAISQRLLLLENQVQGPLPLFVLRLNNDKGMVWRLSDIDPFDLVFIKPNVERIFIP